MTVEECYTQLHGDYNNAKSRLMNDRLISRFLGKFLDDPTMSQLIDAVAAKDREVSFRSVHTLKGVAANMAFTELQQAASNLTEQLRPLKQDADLALLEKVKESYQLVIDTIKSWQASNQ